MNENQMLELMLKKIHLKKELYDKYDNEVKELKSQNLSKEAVKQKLDQLNDEYEKQLDLINDLKQ